VAVRGGKGNADKAAVRRVVFNPAEVVGNFQGAKDRVVPADPVAVNLFPEGEGSFRAAGSFPVVNVPDVRGNLQKMVNQGKKTRNRSW